MGAWSASIWGNDTAEDLKMEYQAAFCCNDPDTALKKIDAYVRTMFDESDPEEWCCYRYSLADFLWKHGILTDDIKSKAVELLSAHTGIDEWEEDGTPSDVRKRIKVMDELLARLNSPMPPAKIKKGRTVKAKHKVGDIVIVRTCGEDYKYDDSIWSILSIAEASDIYKPDIAEKIPKLCDLPYKAYNKYMALLCVDICREPYSQYIEGYYNEYSVYAFYDYLSDERPELNAIKKCGFLPTYTRYCVINTAETECCRWDYKSTIHCCSFKSGGASEFSSVEKISANTDEVKRFEHLLSMKDYSNEYTYGFSFYEAFYSFFSEKIRLESAGIPYDDLLCETTFNPPILTPAEVDAMTKEESKKWLSELEKKLANK